MKVADAPELSEAVRTTVPDIEFLMVTELPADQPSPHVSDSAIVCSPDARQSSSVAVL